jgi:hypothetical protein
MRRPHANRVCARIGCGLIALCAVAVVRGAPLDTLNACADAASAEQRGLEALKISCPQLETALSQLEVAQWLEKGWELRLDRSQLGDLASLIERYQHVAPQGLIDAASLPGILKTLRQTEAPAAPSAWDLFKAWISTWLSRFDRDLGSWVDRLLSRVGSAASLASILLYGVVGLVVIGAAAVVVNELRTAGLLRRSGGPSSARAARLDLPMAAALSPAIETLPMYERPAQLLRLLVRRLLETGRLDRERALTHDELVARGVFDSAEQRSAFRAVAGVAARILYGAQRPPPSEVEPALAKGSTLLSQIAALPGARK